MNRNTPVELTNMCMVYDGQGNVLVEEKILKDGTGLTFPGGHVDCHESIVDSVIREIKEETGLSISDVEFCGIKDWIQLDGSRYIVFLYKTSVYSGTVRSSSEGKVFWMSLEELKQQGGIWHLDKMLEVFCDNGVSELYFDTNADNITPVLK